MRADRRGSISEVGFPPICKALTFCHGEANKHYMLASLKNSWPLAKCPSRDTKVSHLNDQMPVVVNSPPPNLAKSLRIGMADAIMDLVLRLMRQGVARSCPLKSPRDLSSMPTELEQSVEFTPVDVEFESLFRELKKACCAVKAAPHEVSLQKQFCQVLRECKIAFEKVVDTYGERYRSGRGADLLIREAEETITVMKQANAGSILVSIERHWDRITNLQQEYYSCCHVH